jgi:hypothetical protein
MNIYYYTKKLFNFIVLRKIAIEMSEAGKGILTAVMACVLVVTSLIYCRVSSAVLIPEKLVYDLAWTGLKAGTAVLEVIDEKEIIRVLSTASSAKWVSVFYTVEDRVETVLEKGKSQIFVGRPQNYRLRIREGRHRRDKEIIFDFDNQRALFIDHLSHNRKEHPIQGNEFDPLSALFYIRTLKLEVGKSIYVDIFDSKKLWNVEVQVLRKERISSVLGDADTIVIKPLMKSEGIFNRKGEILIWLTDDQRHIPLRMQTRVSVGAVTATLVGGIH